MTMLSEVTNNRTDRDADVTHAEKQAYDKRIIEWLQSRPEVGMLNSGKFYMFVNDVYTEVQPFEAA